MIETVIKALLDYTSDAGIGKRATRTAMIQAADSLHREMHGSVFPFKAESRDLRAWEAHNFVVGALKLAAPTVKVTLSPRWGRYEKVQVANTCTVCGETHEINMTLKKWGAWLRAKTQGRHVQHFWTELSPAEREEFFISGVCGTCWEQVFSEDDED